MNIIFIVSLLLTIGYILLMLIYCIGWAMQKDFILPKGFSPTTFISIIIPARNEAQNIKNSIDAILAQNYPQKLFEIIVVDDHSTDNTYNIVKNYNNPNVLCIALKEHIKDTGIISYKKAAITTGINNSKGELIITTDADCIAPKNWLINMAACYQAQKPVLIIAPVLFTCNYTIVQVFQMIDFMTMQGITVAAQKLKLGNMCNGANLAFTKAAFYKVGGYNGIDHLATGDDYLLMVKLAQLPGNKITYLKTKEAIITTQPQANWQSLLQQRIRWASKSGKYKDNRLTAILLLVYLFNFSFLVLAIAVFYDAQFLKFLGYILLLKICVEYVFILPVARFYKQTKALWYFPILQPLHIAYIIIAGFLGFKGSYEWKGREVK